MLNPKAKSFNLVYKEETSGEVVATKKKHSGPRKRRKNKLSNASGDWDDERSVSSIATSSHGDEPESWFDLHQNWALSKRSHADPSSWNSYDYNYNTAAIFHNQVSEYVHCFKCSL